MHTYHKIAEKFWLVAAILSLLYAGYRFGGASEREEPLTENLVFLLLPLVAGFLFALRRNFRKRLERDQDLPPDAKDE